MIRHVFVYGTLKRGQCRGGLWPVQPISVAPHWVRGTLYGRDDYPAMMPGEDRVRGELWEFAAADMPLVMRVLDQIEGTGQSGCPDHYVRAVVTAFDLDDREVAQANAYHYATDPLSDGFNRIQSDSFVQWP